MPGYSLDLANLEPDRQQYLVNALYENPRLRWALHHPHGLHVKIGPGYAQRWLFSWEEILQLRPPDLSVAHLINLDKAPVWCCWPDGKQCFARTAEELAKQSPGYGPTPDGPWPAGFEGPWRWEKPTKGPFAPSPYGSNEPGGPQAVFTRRSLVYHGQAIMAGALFLLEDSFTDEDLLSKGSVSKVQPHDYDRLFEHELTHWWFMNKRVRDDYAQRYEAHDLTGIAWTVHPQSDTSPAPERAQASPSPPATVPTPAMSSPEHAMAERSTAPVRRGAGRTPESGVTYPGENFLTILTDVVDDLWRQGKGKRRPEVEKIIKHTLWADSISRSNVYKRLQLERPDITLGEFISSRRAIALSQSV